MEHLKRRFPHTGVLSAFSVFSGQDLPDDEAQHETHGNQEIETLAAHFASTLVSGNALKQEWQAFRTAFASPEAVSYQDFCAMGATADMTKFVTTTHLSELYPSLATIAFVGLVLPASTADCERGFSKPDFHFGRRPVFLGV